MLDHAYQYYIQKHRILRINEINPSQKTERIHCQKGDGKGGKQRKYENATEILRGLEIDREEGLKYLSKGI